MNPAPQPGDPGSLRIGDAERDTAASALGEHFAAGRLDSEEYDERIGRVWSARTRAELPPLFGDLPGGPPQTLRLGTGPGWGPAPAGPPPHGRRSSPVAPPTEHWVASTSQWRDRGRAVSARARDVPTWLLVVAAIVLVPTVIALVASAAPVLIAAALVWFFLAGPGKSGHQGQHPWNKAVRR